MRPMIPARVCRKIMKVDGVGVVRGSGFRKSDVTKSSTLEGECVEVYTSWIAIGLPRTRAIDRSAWYKWDLS